MESPLDDLVHVRHCESSADFLSALSPRDSAFISIYPRGWIFRGVSDADFPLVPSALRANSEKWKKLTFHEVLTNEDQCFAEKELLSEFFRVADAIGLHLPEDTQSLRDLFGLPHHKSESWPPKEILSLMALAQHHGMPTRLLDWSRHPLKAALFAAREAAVNSDKSGRIAVWSLCIDNLQTLRDLPAPFTVITAPSATNSNLRAQEGVFTLANHITLDANPIDRTSFDQLLNAWIAQHEIQSTAPWFRCFTFPQSLADELSFDLALEGITEATLYPDFYGVVRAVEDLYRFHHNDGPGKRRVAQFLEGFSIRHRTEISRTELMLRLRPPPPGPDGFISTLGLSVPDYSIASSHIKPMATYEM